MSWTSFFDMGGYGFYVWTSYVLAGVVLVANLVAPLCRKKSLRRELQTYYRSHRS